MPTAPIQELAALDFREDLSEEYENLYGSAPYDLSHWDPSSQVEKKMLEHLQLPNPCSPVPYILPYELQERSQILSQLGMSADREAMIVPTGTSAVLFSAWWLKNIHVNRVVIVCPGYFSTFHACDMLGLSSCKVYLRRIAGQWKWPLDEIVQLLKHPATALWITNPVYCTGVYLDKAHVTFLNSLLEGGSPLVVDECHAFSGKEIGSRLLSSDRLLCLYSPHKAVCVNGAKFASIVFSKTHSQFFTHWDDVLIGGLSIANLVAIRHFLGTNFGAYQEAFKSLMSDCKASISQIVRRFEPFIETDPQAEGYLTSCYVPQIVDGGMSPSLLRELVFATGATVIPGARNHFHPSTGFCFRLNHARMCPQFIAASHRVFNFLSDRARVRSTELQ